MLPVTVMKMSPTLAAAAPRHDVEAVHRRFKCADGIDFGDDHLAAHAASPHRHPFAAPAVAEHDDATAGDQDVGGADDAVERALAGAVAVVEEMLRHRVVDGDHRQLQDAVFFHRPQADDAGGRLFHAGDDLADQARARRV